jgi:hypothetical protein
MQTANRDFRTYIVDGLGLDELIEAVGHYLKDASIQGGRLGIDFASEIAAAEFEHRCKTHRLQAIRKIERFE